jgi:gamma-glutamyl-gamma-aminobutyraldehyde dehydrogenase
MSTPRKPAPATKDEWIGLLRSTSLPQGMWVDGAWAEALSGATSPLVSPRDGQVVAHLPAADEGDIDRVVKSARTAFLSGVWSRLEPRERGEVLIRWADLLEEHRDEMALLVALEMGKPVTDAWFIELRTTINLIRWYGERADRLMDESPRGRGKALAVVSREPLGVVAAITPWNVPMTLATFKVPAALVAGGVALARLGLERGGVDESPLPGICRPPSTWTGWWSRWTRCTPSTTPRRSRPRPEATTS